jgi:tetratricopeptide (TPR) repeat protein
MNRYVTPVLWVIGILFLVSLNSASAAEEKTKSVWVKADELMKQEKYDDAEKLYKVAIEINQGDPELYFAYFNRAQALLALNRVNEALDDYSNAIYLKPTFDDGYRKRGIVYLKIGRYKDAVNDFSRLIELNPKNPYAYVNRGIALSYLERDDKAKQDFDTAISIDPNCAECYYNRYKLLTVMGKESEAAKDLEKAKSLDSLYNKK